MLRTPQKFAVSHLKEEDFKEIQYQMTEGSTFPWYYNQYVTTADQVEDQFQFTHTFFKEWEFRSEWAKMLNPLLIAINPKAWLRIKANLGPRQSEIVEQGWHTDFDFHCTTAVFYLNDTDGYTIFEDGTKVESKANRLVEFDSQLKHSGTSHTNTRTRVVLNLNYIKESGK